MNIETQKLAKIFFEENYEIILTKVRDAFKETDVKIKDIVFKEKCVVYFQYGIKKDEIVVGIVKDLTGCISSIINTITAKIEKDFEYSFIRTALNNKIKKLFIKELRKKYQVNKYYDDYFISHSRFNAYFKVYVNEVNSDNIIFKKIGRREIPIHYIQNHSTVGSILKLFSKEIDAEIHKKTEEIEEQLKTKSFIISENEKQKIVEAINDMNYEQEFLFGHFEPYNTYCFHNKYELNFSLKYADDSISIEYDLQFDGKTLKKKIGENYYDINDPIFDETQRKLKHFFNENSDISGVVFEGGALTESFHLVKQSCTNNFDIEFDKNIQIFDKEHLEIWTDELIEEMKKTIEEVEQDIRKEA